MATTLLWKIAVVGAAFAPATRWAASAPGRQVRRRSTAEDDDAEIAAMRARMESLFNMPSAPEWEEAPAAAVVEEAVVEEAVVEERAGCRAVQISI